LTDGKKFKIFSANQVNEDSDEEEESDDDLEKIVSQKSTNLRRKQGTLL